MKDWAPEKVASAEIKFAFLFHPFINGPTALYWALAAFSVS
jgi:hypothetical protein